MDLQLKGSIDGVGTAALKQEEYDIPIIYLTANADDTNFNRAKNTHPFAFISKPFKNQDLQRAIALTAHQFKLPLDNTLMPKNQNHFILSNCIFVRHYEKMVKVLLVITLKDIDEKLPSRDFLRIHRSFIVNISQIDEVATSHVIIAKKAIPISKRKIA